MKRALSETAVVAYATASACATNRCAFPGGASPWSGGSTDVDNKKDKGQLGEECGGGSGAYTEYSLKTCKNLESTYRSIHY